jgi:hypothetical protein
MTKTLRLGFVMGGGVSLGTFSGAALSEAIKQLIVHGQYDSGEKDANGQPIYRNYDKVEIDVFSGASAGAISLGLMLRVLSNHRDKYQLLGYNSYLQFREKLEKELLGQFGEAVYQMKNENPEKYEGLIAAQALQDIQEKVWAKEVDIHRLLGTGAHQKDLSNNAGVSDREWVDHLGKTFFRFEQKDNKLVHKQLLADRVLFACTLANLNFTIRKQRDDKNGPEGPFLKALNDTSIDRVHSELRVFDLNYGQINPATVPYYPLPWIQYHIGKKMQVEQEDGMGNRYQKSIRNLKKNEVWREITATAIASSAFPFAFEPVVLNRYKYEFGEDWPEELENKDSYPFTYVDGGTFNNEPIREGLRLASYIDNIQHHVPFDRMMIFVDPMVGEFETQFRVNVHSKMGQSRNLLTGKAKVGPKSTLMRLVSKAPHMLTAILNEAQSAELTKISAVIKQFEKRKQMRDFLKATVGMVMDDEEIKKMRDFVMAELDQIRHDLALPPNSLQIQHELIRILEEEEAFFEGHLPIDDPVERIDGIQQFVYTPKPSELPNIRYWLVALACVAQDISMKLTGKTANARIIPIAPFDFYKEENIYELMRLPGGGIAGFAGFASDAASAYEVAYGQYCAYRILSDLKLTRGHQNPMPIPPAFDYSLFTDEVKDQMKRSLLKRVKEMIPNEYRSVLPFMEGIIESNINGFIEENIDNSGPKRHFEFRIHVPSDIFVMRGFRDNGQTAKKNNLEVVKWNGQWYLITQLTYYPQTKKWSGDHVNELQKLFVDKMRLFENTAVLGIELPQLEDGHEAFLSPNPIFLLDARTQLSVGGYTEIKSIGWKLWTDIKPLDEGLWGNTQS